MESNNKQAEMPIFNEQTLLQEIEKTWGKSGAHAEVFRMLLKNQCPPHKSEASMPSKEGISDILKECHVRFYQESHLLDEVIKHAIKEINAASKSNKSEAEVEEEPKIKGMDADELRDLFKEKTGVEWENSQGEPDIDYVQWLEFLVKEEQEGAHKWYKKAVEFKELSRLLSAPSKPELSKDKFEELFDTWIWYRMDTPDQFYKNRTTLYEAICEFSAISKELEELRAENKMLERNCTRAQDHAEGLLQANAVIKNRNQELNEMLADYHTTKGKYSEWISVDEKQPLEDYRILAKTKDYGIITCTRTENQYYAHGILFDDITHWMPLPEAPESSNTTKK